MSYEDKAENTREYYRRQGEVRERERLMQLLTVAGTDKVHTMTTPEYERHLRNAKLAGMDEQLTLTTERAQASMCFTFKASRDCDHQACWALDSLVADLTKQHENVQ